VWGSGLHVQFEIGDLAILVTQRMREKEEDRTTLLTKDHFRRRVLKAVRL
jgi:hypothetical protein